MSASSVVQNPDTPTRSKLPVEVLAFLGTYLDELVREENLNHSVQVILRRIATPICLLITDPDELFRTDDHPARGVFDAIVKIAKLSKEEFLPGDVLYQTVMESIQALKARRLSGYDTLVRVQADLEHVLKLAKIRAPATAREDVEQAGTLSAAKVYASLMILGHARRFNADDALLYFSLTQWLELIVVTLIQKGKDSPDLRDLDRMTFTMFYLNSGKAGSKRGVFLGYMIPRLDELIQSLNPICMGHPANFSRLLHNLSPFIIPR